MLDVMLLQYIYIYIHILPWVANWSEPALASLARPTCIFRTRLSSQHGVKRNHKEWMSIQVFVLLARLSGSGL